MCNTNSTEQWFSYKGNKVITMFFKQRVSLRVEPGISFFYRKYLSDEAIKLLEISLRKEKYFYCH